MTDNLIKISALALAAACLATAPALAESAMQQLQGVQQQSDKAQRNRSLEGAKQQSGQGIDTKGAYAPPVRAAPQQKPSPVGQPISGPGGYKPAATTLRTTAPPAPGAQRPAVQPRTATPTPQPTRTTTPAPQPTRTTTSTPPPSAPRPSTYTAPVSTSTYTAPRSTSTYTPSSSSSSSRPSSSSSSSSSSKK